MSVYEYEYLPNEYMLPVGYESEILLIDVLSNPIRTTRVDNTIVKPDQKHRTHRPSDEQCRQLIKLL